MEDIFTEDDTRNRGREFKYAAAASSSHREEEDVDFDFDRARTLVPHFATTPLATADTVTIVANPLVPHDSAIIAACADHPCQTHSGNIHNRLI
jgi:hypothetical protein